MHLIKAVLLNFFVTTQVLSGNRELRFGTHPKLVIRISVIPGSEKINIQT